MLHISQSLQEVLHALGYILYSPTWEEFIFLCTAIICVLYYLDGTSHYALCDRSNQMSAIWMSQGLHFSGTTSFFHIQRTCLKPHPLEWQNWLPLLPFWLRFIHQLHLGEGKGATYVFQASSLCSPPLPLPGSWQLLLAVVGPLFYLLATIWYCRIPPLFYFTLNTTNSRLLSVIDFTESFGVMQANYSISRSQLELER